MLLYEISKVCLLLCVDVNVDPSHFCQATTCEEIIKHFSLNKLNLHDIYKLQLYICNIISTLCLFNFFFENLLIFLINYIDHYMNVNLYGKLYAAPKNNEHMSTSFISV